MSRHQVSLHGSNRSNPVRCFRSGGGQLNVQADGDGRGRQQRYYLRISLTTGPRLPRLEASSKLTSTFLDVYRVSSFFFNPGRLRQASRRMRLDRAQPLLLHGQLAARHGTEFLSSLITGFYVNFFRVFTIRFMPELGFTWSYPVETSSSLGFTEFYRVLPSFFFSLGSRQCGKALEDFAESVRSESAAPLPKDGTVYEMTSNVVLFLSESRPVLPSFSLFLFLFFFWFSKINSSPHPLKSDLGSDRSNLDFIESSIKIIECFFLSYLVFFWGNFRRMVDQVNWRTWPTRWGLCWRRTRPTRTRWPTRNRGPNPNATAPSSASTSRRCVT